MFLVSWGIFSVSCAACCSFHIVLRHYETRRLTQSHIHIRPLIYTISHKASVLCHIGINIASFQVIEAIRSRCLAVRVAAPTNPEVKLLSLSILPSLNCIGDETAFLSYFKPELKRSEVKKLNPDGNWYPTTGEFFVTVYCWPYFCPAMHEKFNVLLQPPYRCLQIRMMLSPSYIPV